jgi:hypothetical protein
MLPPPPVLAPPVGTPVALTVVSGVGGAVVGLVVLGTGAGVVSLGTGAGVVAELDGVGFGVFEQVGVGFGLSVGFGVWQL